MNEYDYDLVVIGSGASAKDVIGFPSLASTSMEQGRLAAAHAFGIPTNSVPELFPYGIYVFNYPTLAEAYKVAALDAMNSMEN